MTDTKKSSVQLPAQLSDTLMTRLGVSAQTTKSTRHSAPYLRPGDEEEAARQQQALHGGLAIGELDSIQVQHTLAVGQDQGVERQDFEHLQRRDQSASPLLDDVTH